MYVVANVWFGRPPRAEIHFRALRAEITERAQKSRARATISARFGIFSTTGRAAANGSGIWYACLETTPVLVQAPAARALQQGARLPRGRAPQFLAVAHKFLGDAQELPRQGAPVFSGRRSGISERRSGISSVRAPLIFLNVGQKFLSVGAQQVFASVAQ